MSPILTPITLMVGRSVPSFSAAVDRRRRDWWCGAWPIRPCSSRLSWWSIVQGSPQGKPLLEKYNAEDHGGDFYQGVIVNGGHLIYLAGQVANNSDGSAAGVGDLRRQAEKVYENIGHMLRAAGATPGSAVKETTWVLSIDTWRQQGTPVRRAFYNGDYPASTLVEFRVWRDRSFSRKSS